MYTTLYLLFHAVRPYSYSRHRTVTSLQLRLMHMKLFLMIFLLQYGEYEGGWWGGYLLDFKDCCESDKGNALKLFFMRPAWLSLFFFLLVKHMTYNKKI